jgi:hypothetical protein
MHFCTRLTSFPLAGSIPILTIELNCAFAVVKSAHPKTSGPRPCATTNAALTKTHYGGALLASNKVTRSRKRRKEPPYRRVLRFPEVRGKIIDLVELGSSPDDYTIEIRFQDKTALSFDIEPCITGFPELANWRTGEYTPIKRWRPVHSRSSKIWP